MKNETLQQRVIGKDLSITVKGTSISYDDVGEGSIPVIFVHGFPFNKSMWNPQISLLQKQTRVIAYDLRGFGKSDKSQDKLTISSLADDLISFMNALNIHKSIVCGLSMGGYIVLNALQRYADRFEGVVLSDTQCVADTSEAKANRYETIKKIEGGGLNDFASSFVKKVFCQMSIDTKKEIVDRIQQDIMNTSQDTIKQALVAMAERYETCATLPEIKVPVLVICGKEDSVTPVKQSEFLVATIPNAKLHVIENAGHLSNLEQPESFNSHLQNFISSLR